MQGYLLPRYRFLDLVFALAGTLTFLVDLGLDVWSSVSYYETGDRVWAALQLAFYALSSAVLQLLSWGWFWADRQHWLLPEQRNAENASCGENGGVRCEKLKNGVDSADAVVFTQENGGTPDTETGKPWKWSCCQPGAKNCEFYITHFWTFRLLMWPSCLTLLHLLHLGYPLRCLHSLEVGIAAYRNPEFIQYQDYAYFLIHDISMMRLVETFLENTPQLILVLYIIIQRETMYIFQYFSIAVSFICISWALLDYHQSLRMFLEDKEKLNVLSSVIYFLWNFCLISARISAVTLFAVTFQWMIALHFLCVWVGFFIWTCLQKTEFMKNALLEFFYRATVAVILYYSWFNVADGKTFDRCIIYHMFVTIDSIILFLSWKHFKLPSSLDNYETFLICIFGLLTFIGLLLKCLYYVFVHPNVTRQAKKYFDEPDGLDQEGYRKFVQATVPVMENARMHQLADRIYW